MPVSPALTVSRKVTLQDPLRCARYSRSPDLGPRLLFFSGGSALREVCRALIHYTHNSVHIITPFDSGGSSAKIRAAFSMPSVGDLRNRIISLADRSVQGAPSVYRLFTHRLPQKVSPAALYRQLQDLANARSPLMQAIPNPLRRIIRNHFHYFLENMPPDFDLRGASLGNLLLAGGYLNNRRHIEPVAYMFSKLVECRGITRLVTGHSYHLAARLANGELRIGQHRLTGKEHPPVKSPIKILFFTRDLESASPAAVRVKSKISNLIKTAELICYPFGSFYSSLIANLLPGGVCAAIRHTACPKVFIPNPFLDPEEYGLDLNGTIQTLLTYCRKAGGAQSRYRDFLNFVLIDTRHGTYRGRIDTARWRRHGIRIIDTELISSTSSPRIDPELCCRTLLSFT